MVIEELKQGIETAWRNPKCLPMAQAMVDCPLGMAEIRDASDRLSRFAAFFRVAFPETEVTAGIIESPLQKIPAMQILLEKEIDILICLGDGPYGATAWGCDLTYDYVRINGDYRT